MRRQWILILCFAGCLLAAAGLWRLCLHSDSTAFLPAHAGAQWIVDDAPAMNVARPAVAVTTVFKKTFVLNAVTGDARLEIRAFRSAAVQVNGQEIHLNGEPQHWKTIQTADVGGQLKAGTNEIVVSVTNNFGPPVLWLRLTAQNISIGSDASWTSSPVESHWLPVRLAAQPPASPEWSPVNGGIRTGEALKRTWKPLMLTLIVALVAVLLATRYFKRPYVLPEKNIQLLLLAVIAVRLALWLNDVAALPPATGFDAEEHTAYIQFIQQHHALPLPNDGWEMHQPPLYYLVCALSLGALGLDVNAPAALLPLQAVNGLIGLAQCVLVLLCLRRLFPRNYSAQAAGLLIAAFLPPNLYLSFYVTNDPLAGLLVSAAFYFFLRWRENDGHAAGFAAGLGLALGAAVLTKLNSILAVPVFLTAMGIEIFAREKISVRKFFSGPGITLAALVLACGWHYLRVWHQIGALPLPNSQTVDASAWWQEPGYRTAGYYLHFGTSLVAPLFSGMHSFADGLYSTLWADGLESGASVTAFRPPWNYDWMPVACVLAVPLMLGALAGLIISLRKVLARPDGCGLLIAGMPLIFIAGIFYLTLRGPWLAHVKAFYALPALVPFCALIATGGIWLAQKNRGWQTGLWAILLMWTFATVNIFWIRDSNFELWRSRAITCLHKADLSGAAVDATLAVELNPADVDSHRVLAEALNSGGKTAEAVGEYATALSFQPDSPATLNSLAHLLSSGGQNNSARAVKFAARACELTGYRQAAYVTTLAGAYAENGQPAEAREAARIAWQLALQAGDAALLKQNWEFLNQTAGKAP
jgi:hypothetical protein